VQIQDLQHKMLGVLQIGHADKLPAKNGKSNLLRKYIDCCFFKILSCHSVYLSHAILSRHFFVAALFCRGALLSLRSFVAALILRLSFVARSFVARSNVVDSGQSNQSAQRCRLILWVDIIKIGTYPVHVGLNISGANRTHLALTFI
jgi:hypothetical protein